MRLVSIRQNISFAILYDCWYVDCGIMSHMYCDVILSNHSKDVSIALKVDCTSTPSSSWWPLVNYRVRFKWLYFILRNEDVGNINVNTIEGTHQTIMVSVALALLRDSHMMVLRFIEDKNGAKIPAESVFRQLEYYL